MALFNELYYLVDGGTIWTHGQPGMSDSQVRARRAEEVNE